MAPEYRIHRYPTELIERVLHANGARLTLRPVLPQDAPLLQAFVAALSPEARHDRFHVGLTTLPSTVARDFTQVDYRRHLALVAETFTDDGAPVLVADARYVASEDRPDAAELAVAVADGYRGRGLGALLVRALIDAARRAGVALLEGDVLATNQAMLALLVRLGFRIRKALDDARLVRAELLLRDRPLIARPLNPPAVPRLAA
jgi:acetyltransferase